jgi:fatty-acyl-CoA synthase
MGGLVRACVSRHRDRVAFADDERSLTYGDWLQRGGQLANALAAAEIGPGDRVAVMAEDKVGALEAYLGIWLAGATVVQVNARLATPELQYLLEDADVRGFAWTPGLAEVVEPIAGLDDLAITVVIDSSAGSSYEKLLGRASSSLPPPLARPTDAAIIGYTSGTSGRPKGAVVSHRALVMGTMVNVYNVRVPRYSRMAFSGSLAFCATIWGQILPHVLVGGTTSLLGSYDVDSWIARIKADRSTWTYLPTPLMMDFAESVGREPEILDHLATVMHAGSVAPRPHIERAVEVLGGRYLESYGMTEVVGAITGTTVADYGPESDAEDILATAGRPVPNATMWIVGDEGTPVAPGEDGEIVAAVDPAFDGYWNDPEKSEAANAGGVFRTGDVGRVDEHGYLYVTGRRSDLIVSGGMNVYPAEVERVLTSIPGVRQAAVFAIPHPRWVESVATAIVPHEGAQLDRKTVLAHCRRELAGYKKPTRIEFVSELPVSASQKVDKQALRHRFSESQANGR